jgi:glycosyltransferase involved in cell wall biosynthesis
MRVVVCTIVHHPQDARILHRQIRALLDAGHEVSYIAPLSACGVTPWSRPGLTTTDVPRATGRRRASALRAARRELARLSRGADLLIVHDPELLLVLPVGGRRPPTVWDVHEDTAAALSTKAWLPGAVRPAMAAAVRWAERMAERRIHLILAEHGYAERFGRRHPVVPNTTYVPDRPAPPARGGRVVYIGHLSPDRGTSEMIEVGRLLRPHGIVVELIGPADAQARAELVHAETAGLIRWHGFLPNDEAVLMSDGALAGLSLLRDEPNFRHSLPTKVAEYMAHGVPVITSPLPVAAGLVEQYDCGTVVPFGDARAAADAVLRLAADPGLRAGQGLRGHRGAAESLGWPAHARSFVAQLEEWAAEPSRTAHAGPATPAPPVPAQAPPVQVPAPSPARRP